EDGHEIDGLERREYLGAGLLMLHGPSLALQPLHRGVTVEADDQPVAGAARGRQHLDMTGMQDVETAIGEAYAQALPAPLLKVDIKVAAHGYDLLFGGEIGMRQDLAPQFVRGNARRTLLADRNRGRRACNAERGFPIRIRRERKR